MPLAALMKCVAPDRHAGGCGELDQIMRDNATGQVVIMPDPSQLQGVLRANRNALRQRLADCRDDKVDVRYGHRLKAFRGKLGAVCVDLDNGATHWTYDRRRRRGELYCAFQYTAQRVPSFTRVFISYCRSDKSVLPSVAFCMHFELRSQNP